MNQEVTFSSALCALATAKTSEATIASIRNNAITLAVVLVLKFAIPFFSYRLWKTFFMEHVFNNVL
jgi:hypothetical protein